MRRLVFNELNYNEIGESNGIFSLFPAVPAIFLLSAFQGNLTTGNFTVMLVLK